jgi:hypothetical protein
LLVAGINVLTFNVPLDAKVDPQRPAYSRWRFSTTDKLLAPEKGSPTGSVPDGEVEDHLAFIRENPEARFDFGDAPDKPYPTLEASGGAVHGIRREVHLGRRVDAEADGQPSLNADGDDANPAPADDEDGVTFLTPLIPGSPAKVEVIASVDGYLNAWIDFGRDGVWSPATSDEIFAGQLLVAGINVLTFNVPLDAKVDPQRPAYSRWRFSTTDKLLAPEKGSPTGSVPDGEVEDYPVRITHEQPQDERLDFGDAPEAPYPTTLAHDGARHVIDHKIYLGSRVDPEADGQPAFPADGDDAAGIDDEDGVKFATPMVPGHMAKVHVIASTDAKLDAWVDFDQDGTWEVPEQIVVSQPVVGGFNSFEFLVPAGSFPTPTRPVYARFRISSTGGLAPHGLARDGEVEDYSYQNGDSSGDLTVDGHDIDRLCGLIHSGSESADLNGDGSVDKSDMDYLIHDILHTHYGDANLDGLFNSADLIQVFTAGEYEDGIPGNSSWSEGDWNCDNEFDSADMIAAFVEGAYSDASVGLTGFDASASSKDASAFTDDGLIDHDPPDATSSRRPVELEMAPVDQLFAESARSGRNSDDRASQDARDRVFELI